MKKWLIGAALMACTLASAQPGSAPGVAPLVLIVGGPPGNPGDLLLRTLSTPLAAELAQPVVVENRPGAAGTIGLAAVARARPDGNLMGLLGLQSAVAPALIKALPYDTIRDLVPVRQLSWVNSVLVVAADSPLASLKDVIQAGQAGTLTFASGGNGTPSHLAAELFAQQARVQARLVPFNGAAAGANAVLAGHVRLMFATAPAVAGLVHAGKLRALAVAGPERLGILPGVPTLVEGGLPGVHIRDWHGLVAPAGTPPQRIDRVAKALDRILAAAATQQALGAAGLETAASSTPDEFAAFLLLEMGRWGEVVRRAGITLQ